MGGLGCLGARRRRPRHVRRGVRLDRAGYGWSEAGPMPRTAGQSAKELHQLLSSRTGPDRARGPLLRWIHRARVCRPLRRCDPGRRARRSVRTRSDRSADTRARDGPHTSAVERRARDRSSPSAWMGARQAPVSGRKRPVGTPPQACPPDFAIASSWHRRSTSWPPNRANATPHSRARSRYGPSPFRVTCRSSSSRRCRRPRRTVSFIARSLSHLIRAARSWPITVGTWFTSIDRISSSAPFAACSHGATDPPGDDSRFGSAARSDDGTDRPSSVFHVLDRFRPALRHQHRPRDLSRAGHRRPSVVSRGRVRAPPPRPFRDRRSRLAHQQQPRRVDGGGDSVCPRQTGDRRGGRAGAPLA